MTKPVLVYIIEVPPSTQGGTLESFTLMKTRKFGKYELPPLDEDLFEELFHILHSVLLNSNWAATSRTLGVSRATAMKWVNSPPKNPWWNFVLRHVIRELTRQLRMSHIKAHRKRARLALHRLQELPAVSGEPVEVDWDPDESVQEVLIALNEAPGQTLTTAELKRITSLTARQIRAAAIRLCLVREVEGFGEDKVAYYSIPRDK